MNRSHIVHLLAALTLSLLLPATATRADEVQEISKLAKQGQNTQALERINAYLATHPKDAQGRFLKGVMLAEQNKTADAIKIFTGLTEDFPELPEPYNNLAVLYASQGQFDKAKTALEMAIQTHPSYATAHENLGDIYAKMASQAYDKALQLDKNNAAAQTKLSLIKEVFSISTKGTRQPVKTETAKAPLNVTAALPAPAASRADIPAKPSAPAAVPPKPVAQPVAPEKAPAKADDTAPVLHAINGWAKAWSAQNVSEYLAFYARDFKTPKGESRSAWEQSRKERISRPKSIHVAIIAPKVTFTDATHARVVFRQVYRAAPLNTTTSKTLSLVKSGDKWLIQEERVGS